MKYLQIQNRLRLFKTERSFKLPPKSRVTDDRITKLLPNEIFVFGSNMAGHHAGGAALLAKRVFGAKPGVAIGLEGNTYALPTLSRDFQKLPLEFISQEVDDFIFHAMIEPHLTFLVTEIGCGIAGFTYEEIAPMFRNAIGLSNVKLPMNFWKVLLNT